MNFLQPDRQLVRVLAADELRRLDNNASPSAGDAGQSAACAMQVVREQSSTLQKLVIEHGGILLRGLPITTAARFEQLASEFLAVQESYIGGVSRRSRIHNNVYNTTEAPSDVVIEQHLEATHTPRPPDLILFNCQTAPEVAGETPLASFVDLFEALPKSATDQLANERVVYTRELIDRHSRLYKLLPKSVTQSIALSWQEVSGCEEFTQAQQVLAGEGYEVTAHGNGRLRTRCSQPVFAPHPVTGKQRWVLSDQITRQLPWYRALPRRLLRSRLGMEFELASGNAFPAGLLETVHQELARLKFSFPWQAGDVLVLDNHQMSHGRNPFSGSRLILTAFG